MTHIDQIIADALAGLPETDVAILAREVLRLREAPAVVPAAPAERGYPHKGNPGPETICGKFNYWFFRGWQACAAACGNASAIEAEEKQRKWDDRESWIQANRECGVDL